MPASPCRNCSHERGFSLLELLIAASLLLVAVSASLVAVSSSSRLLEHSEQLSGVSNIQRVAQSYLRSLSFTTLQGMTASSLTSGITSQLSPSDWNQLGSTASLAVTNVLSTSKLITIDLEITYAANRLATTSMRFAQWGLNP